MTISVGGLTLTPTRVALSLISNSISLKKKLWNFRTKFMVPRMIVRKIVITKSHVRVKKIKRDILEWRSIFGPLRSRNNAIWLVNKTRSDFELRCRALLITQNYLWCWNLISFVLNLRFFLVFDRDGRTRVSKVCPSPCSKSQKLMSVSFDLWCPIRNTIKIPINQRYKTNGIIIFCL